MLYVLVLTMHVQSFERTSEHFLSHDSWLCSRREQPLIHVTDNLYNFPRAQIPLYILDRNMFFSALNPANTAVKSSSTCPLSAAPLQGGKKLSLVNAKLKCLQQFIFALLHHLASAFICNAPVFLKHVRSVKNPLDLFSLLNCQAGFNL